MPSAYDTRKKKIADAAKRRKYATSTPTERGTYNYNDVGLLRFNKMIKETGVYDTNGRKVVVLPPRKPYHLSNFQPKIRLPSKMEEILKEKKRMGRMHKKKETIEKKRKNSLTDNIKGALERDYRKKDLKIDDRRCYKYIKMLKTGTPRLTVQKLMMKALGDEGFLPELLNNWQEKLIHANSTVNNKTKKNRSSVTSKANYLKKRLQFQENNNISSVDQHEMAMISRNNNTLKLVVTYIIYLLQHQEGRARDLFAKLDTSGDGNLSIYEFNDGLIQLGFTLAEDEMKHLFQAIDDDASGDIEIREFVRLLRQPLNNVCINEFELMDSLRRLEIVISQSHAKAVHKYLTLDHNAIDVADLHELIMSPKDLNALDPTPALNLHPNDVAGRPEHKTYRFSNPLLSTALLDAEEIKAAKDRKLLHKTVKRLENALVASAMHLWRSKVIEGLHQNLKRLSSIKVQKEKVHSPRETKRLEALAKMAEEDPDDQNYGTVLSNAITINAKINMLKMKKLKERKQKKAIELLQNQLCDGSTPRPSWNTSMVFPYRYKKMDKEEIPCLGRMFKPMSFWSKGCNPKVIVPSKPLTKTETTKRKHIHRKNITREQLENVTNIQTFTKHAQYVSPQFKRHVKRPGMSAPTPELGGFYIPPKGVKKDFPCLQKFFEGGAAKKLVRAFTKHETPINKKKSYS